MKKKTAKAWQHYFCLIIIILNIITFLLFASVLLYVLISMPHTSNSYVSHYIIFIVYESVSIEMNFNIDNFLKKKLKLTTFPA